MPSCNGIQGTVAFCISPCRARFRTSMGAQLTRFGHVVPGPLSLDRILNAQGSLPNNACGVVPAAGQSEPIHPVCDGDFIISPLDLTAAFPSQSKTASYYDDGVDGTFALSVAAAC
ncbi:uncharacterized protein B0H18DRAFT_68258 [Fomitopsis serialis]|uniref:uncharacterized protein n=1 Tax=Fomitopsis serialis TaxID=139415 RepID=UPI002008269E|nr:uncharacterized protein B0H18DRAFT_68258 [Neoantrodia serialis]KAH9931826.1 hypothetical protein B0H18DRAFT_68258 [Neoantrodia serialis]